MKRWRLVGAQSFQNTIAAHKREDSVRAANGIRSAKCFSFAFHSLICLHWNRQNGRRQQPTAETKQFAWMQVKCLAAETERVSLTSTSTSFCASFLIAGNIWSFSFFPFWFCFHRFTSGENISLRLQLNALMKSQKSQKWVPLFHCSERLVHRTIGHKITISR